MSVLTGEQKEHMERWIAALRDGKYKQTKSYLKKGDSYCCLGVLCDLEKEVVGGKFAEEGLDRVAPFHVIDSSYIACSPTFVNIQVGLDSNVRDDLMYCNDRGATFEKIAEYLEKYYILGTTTLSPYDYLLNPTKGAN